MPQSLSNLLTHLVFSTAQRTPFLRDVTTRAELHAYLGGVIKHHGGTPIITGGVADHVHLLYAQPKTMTLSDMVRELKRGSSIWIKQREPALRDFAWQGGFGAFSVGQTEVDVVRHYIEQQEEHHKTRTFQEEYLTFLRKYAIAHDERFLWE